MLEAFGIIELYCKRLIEQAEQLDKPEYVCLPHHACSHLWFSMSIGQ